LPLNAPPPTSYDPDPSAIVLNELPGPKVEKMVLAIVELAIKDKNRNNRVVVIFGEYTRKT
jgi:hypothetical protein